MAGRWADNRWFFFRPVGIAELRLIAKSGFRRFPPRLPQQPIFYPVLDESYAVEIARDWNTKDENSGFLGFVTRFEVDDGFAARHSPQTVGSRQHRELWVPAQELESFNDHLVGCIVVLESYAGGRAQTTADPVSHLPEDLAVGGPTHSLRRTASEISWTGRRGR